MANDGLMSAAEAILHCSRSVSTKPAAGQLEKLAVDEADLPDSEPNDRAQPLGRRDQKPDGERLPKGHRSCDGISVLVLVHLREPTQGPGPDLGRGKRNRGLRAVRVGPDVDSATTGGRTPCH